MDAVTQALSVHPAMPRRRARPRWSSPGTIGLRFLACEVLLLLPAPLIGFQHSTALLGLLGAIGAVIGLRNSRVGLHAIGMLCVIDPLLQGLVMTGGLLRWNTFNYWLLLVAVLALPLLLRLRGLSIRLFQALVLLLLTEMIWSQDIPRGMADLLGMVSLFGLMVYLARRRITGSDWVWLAISCGLTGALSTCLFLTQASSLPEVNPNAWAVVPLASIFLAGIAIPFVRRVRGGLVMLTVLVAANALLVFMSGSRGNMSLALVTILYMLVAIRGLSRRAIAVGVAALLALTGLSLFPKQRDFALQRVGLLFDSNASMNAKTSHRSELMLAGWYIAQDHPFGVGTGGFTNAWENLGPRPGLPLMDDYRQMDAHSGWVKIAAENGAPGVLMLMAFSLSFTWVGFRRGSRRTLLLGLWVGGVLMVAFISTEYLNKALWILASAAMVMLEPGSVFLPAARRRRP